MAANQDTGQAASRPKARDLNELIRYTMWSVFRVSARGGLDAAAVQTRNGRSGVAAEVSGLCQQAEGKGIITRGCYDLQEMYAKLRRTALGRASEPVWSAMALHRPAEFNKSHIPAFLAGEDPKN